MLGSSITIKNRASPLECSALSKSPSQSQSLLSKDQMWLWLHLLEERENTFQHCEDSIPDH